MGHRSSCKKSVRLRVRQPVFQGREDVTGHSGTEAAVCQGRIRGAGKIPNSSIMDPLTKSPQARISPPAPVPARHSRQKTCLVTWKTSFVRTSPENCRPSPTSSIQGCTLTLVFPNGLLDLFLMCIYKEFTVGKGLGLPQSAI